MPGKELRLLCLDGGGVRGLSSLQVLKQLMHAINPALPPKPCEISCDQPFPIRNINYFFQPLAIKIWGRRTLIVIDVNYYGYDWHIAHDLQKNILEVYRLVLEKDGKNAAIRRDKTLDLRVNRQVTELHRLNGIRYPPYLADHSPGADLVQYKSLRPSLPKSYSNEQTAE